MQTFTDNAGRTWTLTINVTSAKRVRALTGVNLYGLIDDGFKPLGELVADPITLCDVLYALVQEEATTRQVSDEEFGRGMWGDAITSGADAFVEELVDFFPDARVRAGLRKMIEAGKKVRSQLLAHGEQILDEIEPEAEASRLIALFSAARESSASIPDPSPSGS